MDEFGIDGLDDEALLELMRKRREEAALREQSISSNNDLGRIIAGAAGGLEAAMTGKSGAAGAQSGMNFVAANQQRLAALQADKDSKEMANLTALARIRAQKQQRAQQSEHALAKMQQEYETKARYGEIGPMKDAREKAKLAMLLQDKNLAREAQRDMKNVELSQKDKQFEAQLQAKQAEIDALTRRAMDLEDKRQAGATGRAQIGAEAGVKRAGIAAAAKSAPKPGKDAEGLPVVYGYEVIPGASPTDMDAKEVKKVSSGINGANAALNKLREAIRKNGVRSMPGSAARKELNSIAKSVVIDMKEAANLGALAGPDMDLVLGMMGDPTGVEAMYMGDKEYLKVLDQAQDLVNQKHAEKMRAYGYAPKAGTLPAAQGAKAPSGDVGASGEQKLINGVPYRKVPGGWKKVK